MDYNSICKDYLSANIHLEGLYQLDIPKKETLFGSRTTKSMCGIVIPISGSAKYTVDGTCYILERGKILFAGSNLSLDKQVIGDQVWSYHLLHYCVDNFVNKQHPLMKKHFMVTICDRNAYYVMQKIQEMYQHIDDPSLMSRLKTQNMLQSLITSILEYGVCFQWDSDQEKIRQSMDYIKKNYSRNISVVELAELVSLTQKRFYYIFKKQEGVSPKQYLTEYRMNKSKELLAKENVNISEIASMVGYEDAFNFSRIFKKYTGLAPNHFRERLGKNP